MTTALLSNEMDERVVPNEDNSSCVQTNQTSDVCFICKVVFDRNLKKSRRRILRDRDDLVSPLLLLLWTAQRTGIWFSTHDMHLNVGPLDQSVTQHLQQQFACRKCFERVIKLQRDVHNLENEMNIILDQSFDTLLDLDIIKGDECKVQQLKNELQQQKTCNDNIKTKKEKNIKKKVKVLSKKKKKKTSNQAISQIPQQQHIQKTKQILLLAKSQEGDGQQLLVLQVPANDNEGEDSQLTSESQVIEYNPNVDHHYHNDENGAVFLSSNAIPVTTCVTVTSDDQLLEVQLEPNGELLSKQRVIITEDGEYEEEDGTNDNEDNDITNKDETNEAVNRIPAEERDWNDYANEVSANNQSIKRKADDSNNVVIFKFAEDDNEDMSSKKKKREILHKRAYIPRSSSPLPPAGESKVVVQLLYGSKQWKRTMDGDIKSIIRDMALRRPEPAGRKIAASDNLCSAVMKNYSKRLVSECKDAARTIRVADYQDITQLDMKTFTSEVFLKCPKTANLIKSLIPVEPRDTLDEHSATALIMGVILYMHSMQSNTLQHILSYVLRRAGCNREGFKFLHSLGLTLSYTSILKIMNDIDTKPDIEKSSIDTIEKSIDSVVIRSKNESKKRNSHLITQDSAQDPVLVQLTIPYFPSTTITTSRSSSLTYTGSQLSSSNQTTYTAVPYEMTTDSSNVYTTQ
ncbi:uncharacterized protein LOC128960269 [Oppia nitens]|uniref:uncharacterized protein LOC128960269 n=1 Tax=Oppia nitens TaxID=1686743 RepID=UPI0023DCAA5C|nr:uncharacterized protein LOC128960269 [Oppia nitens]